MDKDEFVWKNFHEKAFDWLKIKLSLLCFDTTSDIGNMEKIEDKITIKS